MLKQEACWTTLVFRITKRILRKAYYQTTHCLYSMTGRKLYLLYHFFLLIFTCFVYHTDGKYFIFLWCVSVLSEMWKFLQDPDFWFLTTSRGRSYVLCIHTVTSSTLLNAKVKVKVSPGNMIRERSTEAKPPLTDSVVSYLRTMSGEKH